ncbi:hypothetical protein E2C01_078286 [Portunus trituberculatus]|uniref:Uncharacterized protein n=1 Tax=Portunus trituberculatus TaxID=210409 RepID=A0A5B7ITR5_PORTR|nr:hypothetical protein [Portunus trituberculatus]
MTAGSPAAPGLGYPMTSPLAPLINKSSQESSATLEFCDVFFQVPTLRLFMNPSSPLDFRYSVRCFMVLIVVLFSVWDSLSTFCWYLNVGEFKTL